MNARTFATINKVKQCEKGQIMSEAEFDWADLSKTRVDLKLPLLLVKGARGILACGYLNVETFNKTGEAAAIVTGVKDFEDMLAARVVSVSAEGRNIGLSEGQNGRDVLESIR